MCRFLLLAILLVLLLVPGCATLSGGETANLPQLADRFTEAMRWKDWHGAARFVDSQQRNAFLEQFKEDPDLQVVDSQIRNIQPGTEEGLVEVVYVLEYYRLPSNRIKEWTWTQEWRQQSSRFYAESVWLISNQPPPLPWNL